MLTKTVTAFAPVLPALATLNAGSTKTRRSGKRVRMYRAELQVQDTPAIREAIHTLLSAGYTVKVYEGTRIYTPVLIHDTLVWEARFTKRDRSRQGYSCVEVVL